MHRLYMRQVLGAMIMAHGQGVLALEIRSIVLCDHVW
jgi:hypothetical protein